MKQDPSTGNGQIHVADTEVVRHCPACSCPDVVRSVPRGIGLTVQECGGCGLAYLSPRPTADAMKAHYASGYAVADFAEAWRDHRDFDILRKDASRIERHKGLRGSVVLDVGCGPGFMLDALGRRGAGQLVGIEPGVEAARFASDALPEARIHQGFYEDSNLPAGGFDVITALDLIEHLYDPADFVDWANSRLAPDGILFIRTPNWRAVERYGEAWEGLWRDFEHVIYFDRSTLTRMLESHGMKLVDLAYEGFRSGLGGETHTAHPGRSMRARLISGIRRTVRAIPAMNAATYRALEVLRERKAREDAQGGWSANLIATAVRA